MYEEFFEMKNTPFTRAIPEENLYETPVLSNMLGRLTYCADKQLFAFLTSDPGCGKTSIINKASDKALIRNCKESLKNAIFHMYININDCA